MLTAVALALATLFAPAGGALQSPDQPVSLERVAGFSTVVINHVNRSIGTESMPVGQGVSVEPGVFVTLGMDRLQVFDHDAAGLNAGLVTDGTRAPECRSGCPAVLFDAFQYEWLKMAVEASYLAVRIPTRVLFASHTDVPAQTLIMAAYAAAETRPSAVPTLSVLVNMAGRGLRAQPVFLLPPEGLELRQGSAALGLTIEFSDREFVVRGADATLGAERKGKSLRDVRSILKTVKKRYPGKESVVLVPRAGVSVGQMMALIQVLRVDFPRVVLSLGQDVIL